MAQRTSPLELDPDLFRALGHRLVDDLAELLADLRSPASRPVVRPQTPAEVQAAVGDAPLPEQGSPPDAVLRDATALLLDRSLLTGHPRFLGYICGAPAPLGILGDLLAAGVNANVGGWALSPAATEIERQAVRWIAELLGYPAGDGVLVSGGNMANFVGFLAARRAKAPGDVRAHGMGGTTLRAYCSAETHTWVEKAADMFGIGTDSIRWIEVDRSRRLRTDALSAAIAADRAAGATPFLVVGTAGSVSTGAVDPLPDLRRICDEQDLWLHVDGAYGAFAACLPNASDDLLGLREADSIAFDPHKWLYAPLEAGAVLVRDAAALVDTFSYHPPYYRFEEEAVNYHEHGPQNSRGFRALKVWLALRQAGRQGYVESIGEDCRLAQLLHELCAADPDLEARTCDLSIATFRYAQGGVEGEELDRLNEEILARLQHEGEVFVSNAVIDGSFFLRACIVNFRTAEADVRALPEIVKRAGAALSAD
ncbi:MAG TPA: aminotransferase class V-fold PLP-dependent enzyme [Gaiellaceae bacterium]|nr:aminotransferase class V-fold PLP-dependent enzyme [Gaiellaceae bacterium]